MDILTGVYHFRADAFTDLPSDLFFVGCALFLLGLYVLVLVHEG